MSISGEQEDYSEDCWLGLSVEDYVKKYPLYFDGEKHIN